MASYDNESSNSEIPQSLVWTSSENESHDDESVPPEQRKESPSKNITLAEKSWEKLSPEHSSSENESILVTRKKKVTHISSDDDDDNDNHDEIDGDITLPPPSETMVHYNETNISKQFHDLTVAAKSTPKTPTDVKKIGSSDYNSFSELGSSGIVPDSSSKHKQMKSKGESTRSADTWANTPSVIEGSFVKSASFNRSNYRNPEVIVLNSDSDTENDSDVLIQSNVSESDSLKSKLEARKVSLELDRSRKEKALDKIKASMRSVRMQDLPDGGLKLNSSLEKESKELSNLEKELEIVEEQLQSFPLEDHENPTAQSSGWNALPKAGVNLSEMGKRALATHQAQQAVTVEALTNLTKSLESCPEEKAETEDPTGLKVELLPHQKQALTWLLWREKQKPSGGVLADDMGLGKTLTLISLILKSGENKSKKAKIPEESSSDDEANNMHFRHKRSVEGKTLVVCPSSVMGQWENEIKTKVTKGFLYCVLHHGPKRDTKPNRLAVYDVVITSYTIVQKDRRGDKLGPLLSMKWERVILDEAHCIRNHKSQTAEAIYLLKAKSRWCLTGTPIQNKAGDFYSLLKFLKCKPFNDLNVWKKWVENNDAAGIQRLNCITKSLLLRRTKESMLASGVLPLKSKEFSVIKVHLDKEEYAIYEKVANFSSTLLAQLIYQKAEKEQLLSGGIPHLKKEHWKTENPFKNHPELARLHQNMISMDGVKSHEILVLLLRLRQICCHPSLVTSMLSKEDMNGEGVEDEDGLDMDMFDKMMNLSLVDEPKVDNNRFNIEDPNCNIFSLNNPVFKRDRISSKIREVISCLKENVLKGGKDKAVLVSQWSSVLEILHEFLKKEDIWCMSLTGKVPVKDRAKIIEKFNSDPLGAQVLLLSLNAGGTGLNLVGGNHLMLIDVHWNPQLETQAFDRVYRVGQSKDVYIYKFVCVDTIEEQIIKLQEDKLNIAKSVLSGSANVNSSKLTLHDLKLLFKIP